MSSAGERLKKIRQELNLTQAEFGNNLGLTSQGISNIEKNKSFFTLDKMQQLQNFNINLNYLVYGCGGIFIRTEPASEKGNQNTISEEAVEPVLLKLLKKHGIIKQSSY